MSSRVLEQPAVLDEDVVVEVGITQGVDLERRPQQAAVVEEDGPVFGAGDERPARFLRDELVDRALDCVIRRSL